MHALSNTAKEVMALRRFFREVQLDLGGVYNIFCDNQQTIRLIVGENQRIVTKLRHVDIHNLWLRQEHANGSFEVTYLATKDMPADGLTKNLPRQKFENFRALLNYQNIKTPITNSHDKWKQSKTEFRNPTNKKRPLHLLNGQQKAYLHSIQEQKRDALLLTKL